MRNVLLVTVLGWLVFAAAVGAAPLTRVRIGLLSLEAPPEAEATLHALAGHAATILPQLESELGVHPAMRYRMILIPPGVARDSEIVRLDEDAPPWAAGYLIPSRRIGAIRIAAAARYPYGTLESVLAHEAAHQLIHDAAGDRVPLWFNEAVATWQGRRWSLQDMMVYTTSLLTSDLPPLAALDTLFHASEGEAQLAYAASFEFLSWNVRRHGRDMVREILQRSRRGNFAAAWLAATGSTLDQSESAWRRQSLIRYRWLPIITASSTFWIVISLFAFAVGVRKRERARKVREQWAKEEEEMEGGEWSEEPEAPVEGERSD